MEGNRKTVAKSIGYLMKTFPAVAIVGARQVGKTTFLKKYLSENPIYDLENENTYNLVNEDISFFLEKRTKPIIFDEAQELPKLFPALRVSIDEDRKTNGQCVVTGSSSSQLLNGITESLAGRVAIFEMNGLDLREAWGKEPSNFFDLVKDKDISSILNLTPTLTYDQLIHSCVYGTYPEAFERSKKSIFDHKLWMENYFKTYVERDIRKLFPGLNLQAYQRFILMLSQNASEVLTLSDYAESLGVSQPTVSNYLRIAEGSFLWRRIPVFSRKTTTQIVKHPKGYIRDSGLLLHNCRLGDLAQATNNSMIGRVWESFISEEIIKGFKNRLIPIDYSFYRTKSKAEVDLIIEGEFGTVPIEIKYGSNLDLRKTRWLKNFVKEYGCDYGLIISNADKVEEVAERIFQIPAGCL